MQRKILVLILWLMPTVLRIAARKFPAMRAHLATGSGVIQLRLRDNTLSRQLHFGNGTVSGSWGVNPKPDAAINVSCSLAGGSAVSATARILQDNDLNAANTFTEPNRVVPKALKVGAQNSSITVELTPLSVATLQVKLS